MDEEKKFVPPMAEVVDFTNDDIITVSQNGTLAWGGETGNEWETW